MILLELLKERDTVVTATEASRICEVAEQMREKRVGSVVIIDDANHVIGIITDRDIALTLAMGAATPDSFVSEAMSRDVETFAETMTLFDVARYFRSCNVKRLPVVDREDRLVGIVSADDVISLLAREMFDTCRSLEPKLGHMV